MFKEFWRAITDYEAKQTMQILSGEFFSSALQPLLNSGRGGTLYLLTDERYLKVGVVKGAYIHYDGNIGRRHELSHLVGPYLTIISALKEDSERFGLAPLTKETDELLSHEWALKPDMRFPNQVRSNLFFNIYGAPKPKS